MLSKKTVPIIAPTSVLLASLSSQGTYVKGPPFLTDDTTFLSHRPPPNTGFGKEHNAQFCVKLTELDFSARILDPGIIFFFPKKHNLRPDNFFY